MEAMNNRIGRALCSAGVLVAMTMLFQGEVGAQVQTSAQQLCINTMNKNLLKVASKQGKENDSCLKNGAKKGGLIEDCLTADGKGKVGKAMQKTVADFGRKCVGTDQTGASVFPDFGVSDPNSINDAAMQKELDLIHAIFGTDLDAAIIGKKDPGGKFAGKCQQKVASTVKKCQDTKLKEFAKCKKNALRDPDAPADDATDLEACIFVDPSGQVTRACVDKVSQQVETQCALKAVDLATAFPGIGLRFPGIDLSDPNELVDALDQTVECLACLAVNAADNLSRDCDEVDDGVLNASCL
jgi:hypothetical protein